MRLDFRVSPIVGDGMRDAEERQAILETALKALVPSPDQVIELSQDSGSIPPVAQGILRILDMLGWSLVFDPERAATQFNMIVESVSVGDALPCEHGTIVTRPPERFE
jgi:hypothetical protein